MSAKRGLILVFVLAAISLLTSCTRGETILLAAPEGGYTDFTELDSFAYYDGHIALDGELKPFTYGTAKLAIMGKPNTEYHLTIILASGESQASGLGYTTSGRDGRAEWSWRLVSQTRPGTYKAIITGGGDRKDLDIVLQENE